MKRLKTLGLIVAVLIAAVPIMAQAQDNGYGRFPVAFQTKNAPAGTVVEPGSELLYILNAGVNGPSLAADQGVDPATTTMFELGATHSNFQNFISVTNSNPTQAVTVHFRFFNSDCFDFLDFLVVLSCNDTMLIDPFDYTIPGSGGIKTGDRFFGDPNASPITPLSAQDFADGRFFLFIVASGDSTNQDDIAETLFPGDQVATGDFPECYNGNGVPGSVIGILGANNNPFVDTNLSIRNASAISFNFLAGFESIAIPTAFLGGNLPPTANDLAYGFNAWTRPAVDLTNDIAGNESNPNLDRDGDGPQAPTGFILSGTEDISVNSIADFQDDGLLNNSVGGGFINNNFFLRSELHGGAINDKLAGDPADDVATGGALDWTLYPISGQVQGALPTQQFVDFLSLLDDYNGRGNPAGVDRSFREDHSVTLYDIVVYNNDEIPAQPPVVGIPPISPLPPDTTPFTIGVWVHCLNAYKQTASTNVLGDNLGDFSVQDLFNIGGPAVQNHLAAPVAVNDEIGPGWVKFIRRQSILTNVKDQFGNDLSVANVDGTSHGWVNIGLSVLRFEGFGIARWLPTAANLTPLIN